MIWLFCFCRVDADSRDHLAIPIYTICPPISIHGFLEKVLAPAEIKPINLPLPVSVSLYFTSLKSMIATIPAMMSAE
jgi:hypothetical protein